MNKLILSLAVLLSFATHASAGQVNCTIDTSQKGSEITLDLTKVNCDLTSLTKSKTVSQPKKPKNSTIVKKWTLEPGDTFMTKMDFRTSGKGYLEDLPKAEAILRELGVSDATNMSIGFTWCKWSDGDYTICK